MKNNIIPERHLFRMICEVKESKMRYICSKLDVGICDKSYQKGYIDACLKYNHFRDLDLNTLSSKDYYVGARDAISDIETSFKTYDRNKEHDLPINLF